MDAIKALHNRVSSIRLTEPGPTKKVLDNIKKAALRAADHGRLRPWRFLVIEGDSRKKLGELFIATEKQKISNVTENKSELLAKKAMRAPTIIIVIASLKQHPVVPEIEQIISAGAAAQNMLNAAKFAKKKGISKIITFTGNSKNNQLFLLGDINFWVDSKAYNHIENIHQILLLSLVDLIIGKSEYSPN